MSDENGLVAARSRAREVRELYETLEQRLLGRTWTLPELAVGFTNDAAYVGRLVLAAERTWDIDGDTDAELRHKLAECLWWAFVLADRLGIDLPDAYGATMDRIGAGLERAVAGR
jgi:NTP pyrophosphatase (non-canonical NTP hydrolase)